MTTKKKMLGAAAGTAAAGGAGLDITDVFSTYLWDGTSSAQTITNGIDLDGEGGLVWMKNRTSSSYSHALQHTTIADGGYLSSNTTAAFQAAANNGISAFNSDGFTFDTGNWEEFNNSSHDYASWTFRKAPKFFDVVTYTGDGASSHTISHNLNNTVGFIVTKRTDSTSNWAAWHHSLGNDHRLFLNATSSSSSSTTRIRSATTTTFTVGAGGDANASGATYVAYLFAHNDGDGEFGPDGSDIIKCGSYTGSGADQNIDLGFEPQFLLIKNATDAADWYILDTMRGFTATSLTNEHINPNNSNAESKVGNVVYDKFLNSTGFNVKANASEFNTSNKNYIYMAIRRGPLAPPEAGTEVFAMDTRGAGTPDFTAGFSVDMSLFKDIASSSSSWTNSARLIQGLRLIPNSTAAEAASSFYDFDYQSGWGDSANGADTNDQTWMWKRAPSFFDVVCYTGDGSTTTIPHNLQVVPEMVINKVRNDGGTWRVHHAAFGYDYEIYLDGTSAMQGPGYGGNWGGANPTATRLAVSGGTNTNNYKFISYLFATLDGVSKVGSFTATGNDVNVDCGFTNGARFVLIKRTNSADDWFVFDTTRGIVAGNDKRLKLNATTAEATADNIDPLSSGFTMTAGILGSSGNTFIFYAIA